MPEGISVARKKGVQKSKTRSPIDLRLSEGLRNNECDVGISCARTDVMIFKIFTPKKPAKNKVFDSKQS
jgi:hypothetical protein